LVSTSRFLKKAYEFGKKHPNVWHSRNRILIPDSLLGVDNCYKVYDHSKIVNCQVVKYYQDRSCRLDLWKNTLDSPPKNSLLVFNVGKRSFFIVWNEPLFGMGLE
jgi:hypothetical protein